MSRGTRHTKSAAPVAVAPMIAPVVAPVSIVADVPQKPGSGSASHKRRPRRTRSHKKKADKENDKEDVAPVAVAKTGMKVKEATVIQEKQPTKKAILQDTAANVNTKLAAALVEASEVKKDVKEVKTKRTKSKAVLTEKVNEPTPIIKTVSPVTQTQTPIVEQILAPIVAPIETPITAPIVAPEAPIKKATKTIAKKVTKPKKTNDIAMEAVAPVQQPVAAVPLATANDFANQAHEAAIPAISGNPSYPTSSMMMSDNASYYPNANAYSYGPGMMDSQMAIPLDQSTGSFASPTDLFFAHYYYMQQFGVPSNYYLNQPLHQMTYPAPVPATVLQAQASYNDVLPAHVINSLAQSETKPKRIRKKTTSKTLSMDEVAAAINEIPVETVSSKPQNKRVVFDENGTAHEIDISPELLWNPRSEIVQDTEEDYSNVDRMEMPSNAEMPASAATFAASVNWNERSHGRSAGFLPQGTISTEVRSKQL